MQSKQMTDSICVRVVNRRTGKEFYCFFDNFEQVMDFMAGLDNRDFLAFEHLGARRDFLFS